ncbi:ABC transporter permease [Devosia pacifica]|uniref:ABC transporter permease n=1 Tax=Devosia pacifica TaxID=1335967 RepID=A0A918VVI3_9HYPH|nr:ABC transporter permease [Devosia pacifica]GHA29680.1 ABC transporter permease [Devosia pacifica]
MSVAEAEGGKRSSFLAFDKLGVLIALIIVAGALMPFTIFRANRIVLGEGRSLIEALDPVMTLVLCAVLIAGFVVALWRVDTRAKLVVGFMVLAVLAINVGLSADYLTPEENNFSRISPGAGFWLLTFAFALMVADALTRLRFKAWTRLGILAAVAAAVAVLLWSGTLDNLSILREYATRADAFWQEARMHLLLAFGAVAIAILVGVPLGIFCYRTPSVRAAILNVLNIVQTIPSIALFGLLIAPLAWVALHVPGARAIGISGIGTAPALVALFFYSLLPIVANTVVGLQSVPEAANDAAKGMGMTDRQRLWAVELPLAFPVILTGIRIVLVQDIGLATIAALIGGGGFGVFVFQGIGQTAMDLVLLGAVPTVALAFAAAVVLDAIVEMVSTPERPK